MPNWRQEGTSWAYAWLDMSPKVVVSDVFRRAKETFLPSLEAFCARIT